MVQAPLTGVVLIIEMTGNYMLILPLFVACFSAQIVADWLGVMPVYDALMEHEIRKNASRAFVQPDDYTDYKSTINT